MQALSVPLSSPANWYSTVNTQISSYKQQAAERAVSYVQSGMIVGLGAGSTARLAIHHLARLLREGVLKDIIGIPCAEAVAADAREQGIQLASLEDHPVIDLTIDGADEVDPQLNLIKGGGGALTREKIVAQASKREIIIVDESKLVPALGTGWAVPIEVIPFGHGSQRRYLEALGATISVRHKAEGSIYYTDQGNYIFDCNFGPIADPARLAQQIQGRAGILEHGLFIGLASEVIVAGADGIRHITP
jgi:ribose 5-phosphate isomerase A